MKQLTILALDNDANGISTEGTKIPKTLPGEQISVKKNEVNLIKPSKYRRHPACTHYSECGGCTTQHATEEFVKDWKLNKIKSYLLQRGIKTDIKPTEKETRVPKITRLNKSRPYLSVPSIYFLLYT